MSDREREELIRLREENKRLLELLSLVQKQLESSLEGNSELRKQMTELQEKLDILLVQYKKRNRKDFGNKTERHNPMRALVSARAPQPPKAVPKESKSRNHTKHIRSQDLPTEQVPHTVKQEDMHCPGCLVETVSVSSKVTYQIERIAQTLKRLEHIQEVRACPKCKQHIVTAEKPASPIPGGYAGPRLIAEITVGKLDDGLPLNRRQKMFKREHAVIPRSTQCDWVIASSLTIEPLYDLLKREVLCSKVVQTDDTELKVQDRQNKRKMRKGKMTVNIGDRLHPYTVFVSSPDKSFEQNKAFFQDYRGYIQADAANGFDKLFKDKLRTEVGCHAHSRRKYFDCLPIETKACSEVLDIYHQLYQIEERVRGKSQAIRLAARRTESKKLMKQLRKKLIALQQGKLNPTNPLANAIDYTLNHWIALTRFLKDPDLEIDNNASERAIKTFVLARKNFLFAGSDRGARAAAIHMSLIASCKRNNVDPVEYLTDVFSRINDMKTSELNQLLPDRWQRARKQNYAS